MIDLEKSAENDDEEPSIAAQAISTRWWAVRSFHNTFVPRWRVQDIGATLSNDLKLSTKFPEWWPWLSHQISQEAMEAAKEDIGPDDDLFKLYARAMIHHVVYENIESTENTDQDRNELFSNFDQSNETTKWEKMKNDWWPHIAPTIRNMKANFTTLTIGSTSSEPNLSSYPTPIYFDGFRTKEE